MKCPPPEDLPNPGIEHRSPTLQADSLPSEPPGKPMKTGMGSLSLLQGIFPTQELNRGILHCRWILYQLSYQGSPRILEWVAYPFSRGSSQPRNRTRVSCIIGEFFFFFFLIIFLFICFCLCWIFLAAWAFSSFSSQASH